MKPLSIFKSPDSKKAMIDLETTQKKISVEEFNKMPSAEAMKMQFGCEIDDLIKKIVFKQD